MENEQKNISRRGFLKGSAAGALGFVAADLLKVGTVGNSAVVKAEEASGAASNDAVFENTIEWDAEFDVIVAGFGAAGAASAITAADEGASVLLLEKATEGHAGGNSAVCKQLICYTPDKELAKTYVRSMRGNFLTPTDEMIDAYVEEVSKNWDWCVEMGATDPTERPAFLDWILRLIEENSKSENAKGQTVTSILSAESAKLSTRELLSPLNEDPISILFVKSDLRLVVNLQECVKAQQSTAYANKVKLSNLKEMSKTVAYIQEHGYDTQDALEDSFSEIKSHAYNSRKELKSIEDRLRQINEQIHYTGQYLANKSIYQQFCESKNKGQFRKAHSAEIALYEAARKFLEGHSADEKLPYMKLLKTEKEQLLQQKKEAQKTYHYYRDYQKELNTVCSNVNTILGQTHHRQAEKQKSTDIS